MDADWAIGCTVIEWDGKSILLEAPNGARKRLEYMGDTKMEKRIAQLEEALRSIIEHQNAIAVFLPEIRRVAAEALAKQ